MSRSQSSLAALTLGAIGVVYGDIGTSVLYAVKEVFHTLQNVRSYSVLSVFLLGFLIYNEGIQTVMSQAGYFGEKVLAMSAFELMLLVLMIQLVAAPAALGVGWISDRVGAKPTLLACLLIWCGLLVAAYFVHTKPQFWVMGVVVALVMGGTQAVGRSIMGAMTPESKTAEFFGFFNLSARAYHRVLKVARTLADLAGAERVGRPHIAEALSYRLNFGAA